MFQGWLRDSEAAEQKDELAESLKARKAAAAASSRQPDPALARGTVGTLPPWTHSPAAENEKNKAVRAQQQQKL
jgi:hypothetical protein